MELFTCGTSTQVREIKYNALPECQSQDYKSSGACTFACILVCVTTFYLLSLGKSIRMYEAVDGKNPITAVTTMPAPQCSVVFGSADSVLRFIDPRKPGLQVATSLSKLIWFRHRFKHHLLINHHYCVSTLLYRVISVLTLTNLLLPVDPA